MFYTQEIVVEGCGGLNNLTAAYRIYPNPTNLEIIVELTDPSQIEEVTLWDAMGRILKTWRIEPSAKHVLDVSDYPSGVYHLRLQGKERHYTAPVWIHR